MYHGEGKTRELCWHLTIDRIKEDTARTRRWKTCKVRCRDQWKELDDTWPALLNRTEALRENQGKVQQRGRPQGQKRHKPKYIFFKRCFNTYPIDATAPPDGKEDDTGIHIKSMYL